MQINQYPNTVTKISDFDYLDLDVFISAGVYQSSKILGSSIINQLGSNFANSNLILTGNRLHDGVANRLTMTNFKDMTFATSVAPTLGLASFNFNGFGSNSSDVTHDFNSTSGLTARMYGDHSVRFFGNVGFNGAGTSTSIGITSNGDTAGQFNGTAYGIKGTGVIGGEFSGSGGLNASGTSYGILAESVSGVAFKSNGVAFIEEYGLGSTIDPSALFQLNSTVKGFLPPRMTTTQINAIPSPIEGLMVYNSTLGALCFKDSTGWRKVSHSAM